jgi:hypothetical protein
MCQQYVNNKKAETVQFYLFSSIKYIFKSLFFALSLKICLVPETICSIRCSKYFETYL